MIIIPRGVWSFPGWAKQPAAVADTARTEFFVHYEGGDPTTDSGAPAMRAIHAVHLGNGWSGIGYNFVIFQDGSIWEGRGWNLVGAHCPDHNTSGVGVQIHIGGRQRPTDAALASCRALYDSACRRSGRALAIRGHQDGYATDCPGTILENWVRAGMPAPAPTIATTAAEGGNDMDLYRDGTGHIWDVSAVGRRYISHPKVVEAYLAKGGKVTAISDAALGSIPRLADGGLSGELTALRLQLAELHALLSKLLPADS